MKNKPKFQEYRPDEVYLLPPSPREWLPEKHLVYFLMDVVGQLDLGAIEAAYDASRGGRPPYDPRMMVTLLLYAYCVGVPSSRRIEKATHESIPFRVLTADQHPDHDTIADFRCRHMDALAGLFVQVLKLCQKAKLVRLGHVALDGTKVRANASKHKAMSYDRMEKAVTELDEEVARLLAEAERVDAEEDAAHGKGRSGDELPRELQRKQSRLKKIREAKAALEAEAEAAARAKSKAGNEEASDDKAQTGPESEPVRPAPKAQRNFTDPESRIMRDGATKSFEQCYNAQAAVDEKAQVIVAAEVTQQANDKRQLEPMVERMIENLGGVKPKRLSADNGYYSENNVRTLAGKQIEGYIAAGRQKHGERPPSAPRGRTPANATTKDKMARKLRTKKGRAVYARRKAIVEPVFGQIKQARGFRGFLLRGLEKVRGEWQLICAAHNLLKLHNLAPESAKT